MVAFLHGCIIESLVKSIEEEEEEDEVELKLDIKSKDVDSSGL